MQDHTGCVVCRQAAENLTLLFQPVMEVAALGKVTERHIKLILKHLLGFHIKCLWINLQVQLTRDNDFS